MEEKEGGMKEAREGGLKEEREGGMKEEREGGLKEERDSWTDAIYNRRSGEFFGRTSSSWGELELWSCWVQQNRAQRAGSLLLKTRLNLDQSYCNWLMLN